MKESASGNSFLKRPETQRIMNALYGDPSDSTSLPINRFKKLTNRFVKIFNKEADQYFSAPGRIEIGGNHTDHNHGRILAAATQLDAIGLASVISEPEIVIHSEGFDEPFHVKLTEKMSPQKAYEGTTTALIQGIVARFQELGYQTGGFQAVVSSQVFAGSGLSSSASIELLIASILNGLYNNNKIDAVTLAKICQYSENVFFNKPCGLMDQLISAVGGIAAIDFRHPESPDIRQVKFDFNDYRYQLFVVSTGGDHAKLIDDYAAIPEEMKSVAHYFGGTVCRDISLSQLMDNIKTLRTKTGDRAVLRAYHFLTENQRVLDQVDALSNHDLKGFLSLVNDSGNSSAQWLQNVFAPHQVAVQGVTLALALTTAYIRKIGEGACRVHGGGFAGTILAFIPDAHGSDYRHDMEKVFGQQSVLKLSVRPYGALHLNATAV